MSYRGKQVFDFILTLVLLIVLSPIWLVVTLLVLVFLGWPVYFTQTRIGYQEREFRIYKFRSMTNQRDAQGKLLSDAQRLKAFGLFMRNSSLDELPQLLNILKGDMSFVGPRPLLKEYLPLYSSEQRRRHTIKPGVTGWAQINGRNNISWTQKFSYDIWYVDHPSLALDLRILWRTFHKVIQNDDVAKAGHVTTDYFNGHN